MSRTPKRRVSEHDEQCKVIQWAQMNEERLPALKLLHAIPNGGKRHISVAMKLKAEGVKRGVPDLALPYPIDGKHGLYVEMKAKDGRPSEEQSWWVAMLGTLGYRVEVCYSGDDAIKVIREYVHDEELPFVPFEFITLPVCAEPLTSARVSYRTSKRTRAA